MTVENEIDDAVQAAIVEGWAPERFVQAVEEAWIEVLKEETENARRWFSEIANHE